MKSNVCKIDKGTKDLNFVLKECEKVAVYNELDSKQSLHLRLLCEELDGMLPVIVGDFDGDLWIEFENGVCKIYASIEFEEATGEKKEQLIALAKNKKNAAASSIVGKIRSVVEDFFLDGSYAQGLATSLGSFNYGGFETDASYTYYWSLDKYKSDVKDEKEAWDELEKSVIATIADDVVVGIKGRKADIVLTKKFY